MLTATYSIVALELEQKKVRWTFSSLQQYIKNSIRNFRSTGGVDPEQLAQRISQFEQFCQQRRMAVFLIPVLRKCTHEADALLDELEKLNAASTALVKSLQKKLRLALTKGAALIDDICASLEQCCLNFYQRLNREDELVKIAERVIPNEVWFGLATSLMSEYARKARIQASVLSDDED
jgi:hypothetical protein